MPPLHKDPTLPKGNIKSLRLLAGYVKPYRRELFFAMLALLFTSISVLALGAAIRYMVDEGLSKGNHDLLNSGYLFLMAVTLLLAAATFARFYLFTRVGEKLVASLRSALYSKLLAMPITFFETTRTGELLSRLSTDTTLLQSVVGSSISVMLRNSVMLAGGIVLLLFTSPSLTGYVAVILPVVVIPIIILGKKLRLLSRDSQDKVADVNAHGEETINAIRSVQALSLESYEQTRFFGLVDASLQVALKRIKTRAWLTAIVIGLVFGAIVTVMWIGGRQVVDGTLSPGELSSFVFYAIVVAGTVGGLSDVMGELQRAAGATERLMELLDLPNGFAGKANATLPSPLTGRITFERVSFTYPSRPLTPALSDISFAINPGETVALVGPSGAGKSTVFQMLLRFYEPSTGKITFDGVDIAQVEPRALRESIGLVPQEPVIFSTDVWQNIRCGKLNATKFEILDAAKASACLEFIEMLPYGMDSYLGEKGVRLSGGQKQRLAIARAFVRNPSILLLDEATSALDTQSETLVRDALAKLMEGRTTFIITHRLATIAKASRILLLNDSKLEAQGTHAELLRSSPLYARLAEVQFTREA